MFVHRLRVSVAAALFMGVGVPLSALAGARTGDEAVTSHEWLDAELGQRWGTRGIARNDTAAFERRQEGPDPMAAEILVVVSKSSPAYETSFRQILREFEGKGISARFQVFNARASSQRMDEVDVMAQAGEFDLIFAMGSWAAKQVQARRTGWEAGQPIVTVCAKDPVMLGLVEDYQSGSGTNIAFTALELPVPTLLHALRTLRSDLSELVVVSDENNVSVQDGQIAPIAEHIVSLSTSELPIELHRVEINAKLRPRETSKRVAARVAQLASPKQALILVPTDTTAYLARDAITAAADNIPVITTVPGWVTAEPHSPVAGIGVSYVNNAKLAASYAFRILAELEEPWEQKVGRVDKPDVTINFRRARAVDLAIEFDLFEAASNVYGPTGALVRREGKQLGVNDDQ